MQQNANLRTSSSQSRNTNSSPKPAACTTSMVLPQLKAVWDWMNPASFWKVTALGQPEGSLLQQDRHCFSSSAYDLSLSVRC